VYKINNTLGGNTILIYPNPASGSINIQNANHADVSIFNQAGQLMLTQKNIGKLENIQIPDLKNGVYFIKLSKDNSYLTEQIVVRQN
jgi:hypothetical protein